jgi:hypothetical protein
MYFGLLVLFQEYNLHSIFSEPLLQVPTPKSISLGYFIFSSVNKLRDGPYLAMD